jgi:hypothetical protein
MRDAVSETVLKLLLEELTSIRITCPQEGCGAVMELSLKRLPTDFDGKTCPVCRKTFIPAGADFHAGHIQKLAASLQALVGLKDSVEIRVVVPVSSDQ